MSKDVEKKIILKFLKVLFRYFKTNKKKCKGFVYTGKIFKKEY